MPDGSLQQAHAHLLQDSAIQFERTTTPSAPSLRLPPLGWLAGNADWLLWGVLGLVLAGTAFILFRQLRNRSLPKLPTGGMPSAEVGDAASRTGVAQPAGALPEADALAAVGRFGEAVHLLLLHAVAAIDKRFPRALAPSHTSRDIARLAVLPPSVRSAFEPLAERTERAVFAGRSLTRAEWELCRARYAGLSEAAQP